jgi:hypothetical protein
VTEGMSTTFVKDGRLVLRTGRLRRGGDGTRGKVALGGPFC